MQRQNDKAAAVQNYLSTGMSRTEIALKLGYSSWRSLDIYMRRLGMRWNGTLNSYVNEDEVPDETGTAAANIPAGSGKAAGIIAAFSENDADPKEIAKKAGFKDHLEMASYMALKGYVWSVGHENYIAKTDSVQTDDTYDENGNSSAEPENRPLPEGLDTGRYTRLLDILLKHEERLLELLIPEAYSRTIPRYFVPGITRTKSFYMSDSLSRLLNEFCNGKNLSQKEVIEAALVEFLSKYSYKKEIDALIRGS